MAFTCQECYDKLHPDETKPTMWDIFLKSLGCCETSYSHGDKERKVCVDLRPKD